MLKECMNLYTVQQAGIYQGIDPVNVYCNCKAKA